jgi:hypothetical protein
MLSIHNKERSIGNTILLTKSDGIFKQCLALASINARFNRRTESGTAWVNSFVEGFQTETLLETLQESSISENIRKIWFGADLSGVD